MRLPLVMLIVLLLLSSIVPLLVSGHPAVGNIKRLIVFYGQLDKSNLEDLDFDVLVFAAPTGTGDHWSSVINNFADKETFAYVHDGDTPVGLGTTFKQIVIDGGGTVEDWVNYWKNLIDVYASYRKNNISITGIFLDECDPEYFGTTDPNNPLLQDFIKGVQEIVEYAHNESFKVFINGVRGCALYGDYYLWEDFLTYPNYTLVSDFMNTTDNGNPFKWEGTLAKYYWLKEHNLLDKTFALTYANEEKGDIARAGYVAAFALGLAGWGVAVSDLWASTSSVSLPIIPDLGMRTTQPIIEDNRIGAGFIIGYAYAIIEDPPWAELPEPFSNYVYAPIIDGIKDNIYDFVASANASYSKIDVYYAASPVNFYVYIEPQWYENAGVAIQIYMDMDGDPNTGFREAWTSEGNVIRLGAEYLVEIYLQTNNEVVGANLYKYNGDGTSRSWVLVASLKASGGTGIEVKIPLSFIDNILPMKTYVVSVVELEANNWVLDAVANFTPNMNFGRTRSIYEPINVATDLSNYAPVLVSYTETNNEISLTIDAPTGEAIYQIATERYVDKIYVNGELASITDNIDQATPPAYTITNTTYGYLVTIKVKHASPVTIDLYFIREVGAAGVAMGGETLPYIGGIYTFILPVILSIIYVVIQRKLRT